MRSRRHRVHFHRVVSHHHSIIVFYRRRDETTADSYFFLNFFFFTLTKRAGTKRPNIPWIPVKSAPTAVTRGATAAFRPTACPSISIRPSSRRRLAREGRSVRGSTRRRVSQLRAIETRSPRRHFVPRTRTRGGYVINNRRSPSACDGRRRGVWGCYFSSFFDRPGPVGETSLRQRRHYRRYCPPSSWSL